MLRFGLDGAFAPLKELFPQSETAFLVPTAAQVANIEYAADALAASPTNVTSPPPLAVLSEEVAAATPVRFLWVECFSFPCFTMCSMLVCFAGSYSDSRGHRRCRRF